MTITKITSGNRTGFKAHQLTLNGRIIVAIAPTHIEAIKEVLKEINNK